MRKSSKIQRADIFNNALNYIYSYIDTDLKAEDFAKRAGLSIHHFHRIFKEEGGRKFFETIKSIRLQKAASLLLTNRYATISQIALMCGYASQTSFIKAFKERFNTTPKAWQNGDSLLYSKKIMEESGFIEDNDTKDFSGIIPRIIKTKPMIAAYVRHTGYDISIKNAWNRLYTWSLENNIPSKAIQLGIHHDNPIITPTKECAYVAAIEVKEAIYKNNSIAYFKFPPHLCAVFRINGKYGDVLNFIRYVYQVWLPNSGFEAKTIPSYSIYHKNHFLSDDDKFDADFYLPVSVV